MPFVFNILRRPSQDLFKTSIIPAAKVSDTPPVFRDKVVCKIFSYFSEYLSKAYAVPVIFLLFFFPLSSVYGQQAGRVIYKDSVSLRVKHRKYKKHREINDQRVTDQFIDSFSRSIPRILAYTTFSIHWEQTISVSGQFLHSRLSGLHIRGYNSYRGFPVSEHMLPERIRMNYHLNYEGRRISVADTFQTGASQESRIKLADSLKTKKIDLDSLDYALIYELRQKERFTAVASAIDQYYEDFALLKEALEKVATISTGNLNMLPIYNARLKEAENTLKRLRSREYLKLLDLENHDPLQFHPRFLNLKNGISFKRKKIDRQMKNLDRLYHRAGVSYLKKDTSISRKYFQKAIQSNPYYTASWLWLARLDLSAGFPGQAADKVAYIFNELKPDTQMYRQTIGFSDSLSQAFVSKAQRLMANSDYNEAIQLMERAQKFCIHTKQYECPDAIDKHLSLARYGIYNAYISVARKAIEQERPAMALEYITMVDTFRRNNQSSIVSGKEVDELYEEVAGLFLEQAEHLLNNQQYKKALSHFRQAGQLCKTSSCENMTARYKSRAHRGIYKDMLEQAEEELEKENYNNANQKLGEAQAYVHKHKPLLEKSRKHEQLKQQLAHEQYKENMKQGWEYLQQERNPLALREFDKASAYLSRYATERNDTLDSLARKAARPQIRAAINYIKQTLYPKFEVIYGKPELLEKEIVKIEKDTAKYGLTEDKEIAEGLKELRDSLEQEICKLVQDSLNDYRRQGKLEISDGGYLEAEKQYQKALEVAGKNPQCETDSTEDIKNKMQKYKAHFRFLGMKRNADQLYRQEAFSKVMDTLQQMMHYFKAQDLENKGLSRITPVSYARAKNDHSFSIYVIEHYLQEQNDSKNALAVLKDIDPDQLSEEDSKKLQKRIAKALAKKDAQKNTPHDYREKAAEYSDNSKRFNLLERYYKSEYRKEKGIFPYFF
ncbi:MAG: hypothetical protein R6U19_05890 [Bacteroidales bacterium]